MTYEKKRVLITVKTYPTPSKKSNETVCTAGITENGEWIRLYPIPYRYLNGEQKFRIFDWIEVSVAKRDRAKGRLFDTEPKCLFHTGFPHGASWPFSLFVLPETLWKAGL